VAKEILQLQRDMAQLQEQVRTLQRAFDTELAKSQQLLSQNLEASGRLATAIAVLEKTVHSQEKVLATPVAAVNTRVDTMASQFQALRDAVDEMNSRLSKLQQQIVDIKNIVSTVPPPTATPSGGPAPGVGAALSPGPTPGRPPIQAETLWKNALRDYTTGNYDLAGPQFNDYIKYFGNTDQAADAQYYLGEIFYQQREYARAEEAYDLVLERYPDGRRTPDAQYKKGLSLLRQNKRDLAAKEFREVIRRFPTSVASKQAGEALRGLGLPASAPATRTPAKTASRRK